MIESTFTYSIQAIINIIDSRNSCYNNHSRTHLNNTKEIFETLEHCVAGEERNSCKRSNKNSESEAAVWKEVRSKEDKGWTIKKFEQLRLWIGYITKHYTTLFRRKFPSSVSVCVC